MVVEKDNKCQWTNVDNFSCIEYLISIKIGLYAMKCDNLPNLFRIGVCGIRSKKNNANERLKQVNNGVLKRLGKWSYAFLAVIPDELTDKARECEICYQSYMFKRFAYVGASHIDAPNLADLQNAATEFFCNLPEIHKCVNRVMPPFSRLVESQVVKTFTTAWNHNA